MKFLVDAQLPRRLAALLNDAGHDAVHTLDLPDANRTTDAEVIATADREGRVVVTKDSDFVDSFLIKGEPKTLLLLSTGNISNGDLLALFLLHLPAITAAFDSGDFAELTRTALILHS